MLAFHPEKVNPCIIRCGYMNKSNCPPSGSLYEHRRVKWYEIELILWGEGCIITEGQQLETKRGDVFFRTPGMSVQGIAPYFCYLIVFDMIFDETKLGQYRESNSMNSDVVQVARALEMDQIAQNLIRFDFPWITHVKQYDRFKVLFENIYEESMSSRVESPLLLKTYMLQILALLYAEHTSAKITNNPSRSFRVNYPKIMKTKEYIDSNICHSLSLFQLSELAGLSPNFFCKIFKEIIGLSPIHYINKCRVSYAKRLLLETNKSVKEISYECGFENEPYFFTLFKRYENTSPLEFRTRHRLGLF